MNSPEKKCTAIEVLYRDAANYKTWQTHIFESELTLEQLAPYLELDKRFIGQDVGIEDLMLGDRRLTRPANRNLKADQGFYSDRWASPIPIPSLEATIAVGLIVEAAATVWRGSHYLG